MSGQLQQEEIADHLKAVAALEAHEGRSAAPCSRLVDYHAECTKAYGKTPSPYQAGVKTGLECAIGFVAKKCCPWCGGKLRVEWEPCEPIAKGETNRAWYAECERCMAHGPICYTEPEAAKYLPENS